MKNVKELWSGLEPINVKEEIKKAEAVLEDIEKKARKLHILRNVAIAGTVITLMAFPVVDYLIRNKVEPDIISLVLLLTSGIFGFAWFALNQEIEDLELKAEEFQPLLLFKNAKGIIVDNLYPIDMVSFYKRELTLLHPGDKHVIYFVEVPEKTEPVYLKFCKPAHELTERRLSHV